MTPKPLPTVAHIRENYIYNPETGVLTDMRTGYTGCRRLQASTRKPAGIFMPDRVNGKRFHWAAHRLIAFAFLELDVTPELKVDHRDGNAWNNLPDNLRVVTHQQNICNQATRRDKKHDVPKGVYYSPKAHASKPYKAMICFNQKDIFLGYHCTAEAAHTAYKEAAVRLHGEFARFS